jgi:hypothetical protein
VKNYYVYIGAILRKTIEEMEVKMEIKFNRKTESTVERFIYRYHLTGFLLKDCRNDNPNYLIQHRANHIVTCSNHIVTRSNDFAMCHYDNLQHYKVIQI